MKCPVPIPGMCCPNDVVAGLQMCYDHKYGHLQDDPLVTYFEDFNTPGSKASYGSAKLQAEAEARKKVKQEKKASRARRKQGN